jgi:hypothetical protein
LEVHGRTKAMRTMQMRAPWDLNLREQDLRFAAADMVV